MLLRSEGLETIAFSQPSHAWLSGQLARQWGNAHFAPPEPFEDVCLATEQHDLGWQEWEAAPALNEKTGLPQQFFEVPGDVHMKLWREGIGTAQIYGRFVAVLVSLHAVTIYGFAFDPKTAEPAHAAKVHAFLDALAAQREEWLRQLRANPQFSNVVTNQALEHCRLLIGVLDRLSLDICFGVKSEKFYRNVPMTRRETTDLRLRPVDHDPAELVLTPWPFRQDVIKVRVLGKLLHSRFASQAQLDDALLKAQDQAVETILRAGETK
ncbi:DUF3891 family protein [Beijerinckia indica]|uniref:DUF3891 domain-containing protein n=1 Tax=Beijerinckia indica subsp. indica (strain ATCC 9039 / DSM 1715 / NCIMB 8712) TaxID=395963 RepID=B2IEW4_BEII9|nr:DUF3891 family protein [Beijerinckia indica]ACB94155.1 hypothetical protein Bind_0502 [Beijerinckia indica subsp. indica ATCC 9039]